jgi:hypothetical protein
VLGFENMHRRDFIQQSIAGAAALATI